MAEQDPTRPQAIDPEVTADLTRLLRIRGPLGILNVLDTIVPVVSLGNVVTPDINVRGPTFRSTDVFSAGLVGAPVIGTVLADTLALPAGTYDVIGLISITETNINVVEFQHRDAANASNLMVFSFLSGPDLRNDGMDRLTLSYELAANERLRFVVIGTGSVGSNYSGVIFARAR